MAKTMSEAPGQGLAVDELTELLRDRARDHGGDKLLEAAAAEIDRLSDLARRVEGDDEALLISMATCLNHGFGLLDRGRQQSAINDMRKVLDEVAGRGYYRAENRNFYLSMRSKAPLPLDAGEGVEGG